MRLLGKPLCGFVLITFRQVPTGHMILPSAELISQKASAVESYEGSPGKLE